MLSILSVALATALAAGAAPPPSADALLHSPARHVRAADGRLHQLLARGVARSKTFAALLARLDASDVIVYVERNLSLPSTLEGRLLLLPVTTGQRYLRIQVRAFGQPDESVALIAHELRHAVEIADAPFVRDEPSLVGLYERIGHCVRPAHQYDTQAANDVERQVRTELTLN